MILAGSYDIGFTLDLACKDLGLAQGLGRAFGVPLEVAGLVEQIFERALPAEQLPDQRPARKKPR